jgi:hypothetical protein
VSARGWKYSGCVAKQVVATVQGRAEHDVDLVEGGHRLADVVGTQSRDVGAHQHHALGSRGEGAFEGRGHPVTDGPGVLDPDCRRQRRGPPSLERGGHGQHDPVARGYTPVQRPFEDGRVGLGGRARAGLRRQAGFDTARDRIAAEHDNEVVHDRPILGPIRRQDKGGTGCGPRDVELAGDGMAWRT